MGSEVCNGDGRGMEMEDRRPRHQTGEVRNRHSKEGSSDTELGGLKLC